VQNVNLVNTERATQPVNDGFHQMFIK